MATTKLRNRWYSGRSKVELRPDVCVKAETQQQFKDDCDMNRIVKNAMRGVPPKFMARGTPQYGDFSRVTNLSDAYEVILRAEEAFMELPAELRRELSNDPRNLERLTPEQAKRFGLTVPQPAESEAEAPPSPAGSPDSPKAPGPSKKKAPTPPPSDED